MTGVLLALGSALGYGLSDFIGGLASRRTSAWPVAFLSAVGGLLGAVVLATALTGDATGSDLWWGALAGIGSGTGGAFLYRGLAAGRMGVVAPVSAVGAVMLPVAAGLLGGERPSLLVWLGIAAAVPGIWLVSREPAVDGGASGSAAGLADGAVAGLGFGLLFAAMGQVPEGAGYWPLVVAQSVALVAVVVTAGTLFGARWWPAARTDWWGLVAGLLASAAVLTFVLAVHRGLLAVAAVLTSLYPAFTILLAATVVKERIHPGQAIGLALCAVTVGLVAGG